MSKPEDPLIATVEMLRKQLEETLRGYGEHTNPTTFIGLDPASDVTYTWDTPQSSRYMTAAERSEFPREWQEDEAGASASCGHSSTVIVEIRGRPDVLFARRIDCKARWRRLSTLESTIRSKVRDRWPS